MDLYKTNSKYKVIKYDSKDDWCKDRIRAIGGSDVSSIIGCNPYKQSYELWEEKKGIKQAEDISEKSYVRYGTLAEEHLRKLFELDFENEYEVQYLANCTLESKEYPFMHYSPDGLLIDKRTGAKGIWECKTTNIVQSSQKEKWVGDNIPQNYYCQILHGLNVTGFDFVILKAQLKFENKDGLPSLSTRHYFFSASDEQVKADMEYLKEQCINWWEEYYVKGNKPSLIIKF